eukprot:TRINITY_DN2789_c0_g1_i3.p2 TRINITY_DN2789_c0_g1~~TRINITY_DN2789_c0_g1_i3.p2  ORF type:complete len:104 (+),score=20.86 TRINITY_DN2789_c0_g1_i3:54-365(+)
MDRIIYQGSCSVKVSIRNIDGHSHFFVNHTLNNTVDNILNFWFVNINESECCKVCSSIFEVFQIDCMSIQAGQKEKISLGYQADLLGLLEDFIQYFLFTIQNN